MHGALLPLSPSLFIYFHLYRSPRFNFPHVRTRSTLSNGIVLAEQQLTLFAYCPRMRNPCLTLTEPQKTVPQKTRLENRILQHLSVPALVRIARLFLLNQFQILG